MHIIFTIICKVGQFAGGMHHCHKIICKVGRFAKLDKWRLHLHPPSASVQVLAQLSWRSMHCLSAQLKVGQVAPLSPSRAALLAQHSSLLAHSAALLASLSWPLGAPGALVCSCRSSLGATSCAYYLHHLLCILSSPSFAKLDNSPGMHHRHKITCKVGHNCMLSSPLAQLFAKFCKVGQVAPSSPSPSSKRFGAAIGAALLAQHSSLLAQLAALFCQRSIALLASLSWPLSALLAQLSW